jgi:hypothetical protein
MLLDSGWVVSTTKAGRFFTYALNRARITASGEAPPPPEAAPAAEAAWSTPQHAVYSSPVPHGHLVDAGAGTVSGMSLSSIISASMPSCQGLLTRS